MCSCSLLPRISRYNNREWIHKNGNNKADDAKRVQLRVLHQNRKNEEKTRCFLDEMMAHEMTFFTKSEFYMEKSHKIMIKKQTKTTMKKKSPEFEKKIAWEVPSGK